MDLRRSLGFGSVNRASASYAVSSPGEPCLITLGDDPSPSLLILQSESLAVEYAAQCGGVEALTRPGGVHPAVAPVVLWVLLVAEQLAVHPPGMLVAILGASAVAVALCARRSRPLASVLVVLAVVTVQAPLGVSTKDTSLPVLPVFWAIFLAFSALHGRQRLVGLAAVVVALTSGMLLDGGHVDLANLEHSALFAVALCLPAAITGTYVDSRHRYALALEEGARAREAQRRAETATAVAEERLRIARELHDVIAHGVGLMGVQAGAVRRRLRADQKDLASALLTVEETGRAAITELGHAVGVLRDPAGEMAPQPTLAQLRALVEAARESGQQVSLTLRGPHEDIPVGVGVTAYRIVQELLTNARKHARGNHVAVTVARGCEDLTIEALNATPSAGRGRRGPSPGGHGLIGIRERVATYGGSVEITNADNTFAVTARLPITR